MIGARIARTLLVFCLIVGLAATAPTGTQGQAVGLGKINHIIVIYHVAPPVRDKWGPGTRVPAIVVSPFAKRRYIDHTQYDTTSILKLIETRWNLAPLGMSDRNAGDLRNAFAF